MEFYFSDLLVCSDGNVHFCLGIKTPKVLALCFCVHKRFGLYVFVWKVVFISKIFWSYSLLHIFQLPFNFSGCEDQILEVNLLILVPQPHTRHHAPHPTLALLFVHHGEAPLHTLSHKLHLSPLRRPVVRTVGTWWMDIGENDPSLTPSNAQ